MILLFNSIIIIIFLAYILNSYFLSIKENIIKLISFLIKVSLSLFIAFILAPKLTVLKISSESYRFIINERKIKNFLDLIKVILIKNFPEIEPIIIERTEAIALLEAICTMLIRIVLVIICFLFLSLIMKIIFWLLKKYNIIRINYLAKSKLKGLGFGFIQGIIMIFIISIPFAGLSTLTNELIKFEDISTNSNEITFLKDYRKTITGRIFKFLNINNKSLDVHYFDQVFVVRYNDEDIYLSEEVSNYIELLTYIKENNLNIELENLEMEALDELIFRLKTIKTLNITTPILIDYFLLNYYELKLSSNLYQVDFYNDVTFLGELVKTLIENDKFNYLEFETIDTLLVIDLLNIFSKLDSIDKLSNDITYQLTSNKFLLNYFDYRVVSNLKLNNVNYKKEVTLLKQILENIYSQKFDSEKLASFAYESDIVSSNQRLILELIIWEMFYEYRNDIIRYSLEYEDYLSVVRIAKAYVDNGYLEPYFRLAKLYDAETVEILIDAIYASNFFRNNLDFIIDMFLSESIFKFDFKIVVPSVVKENIEVGKGEIRSLIRLFQILNYGITQATLEKHLDELCDIFENSIIIRDYFHEILETLINKYNPTDYKIYIKKIDYNTPDGRMEYSKLIDIFRMLVQKRVLDDPTVLLKLTKEEIDYILTSSVIEEACINLLIDLGKADDNPLVVTIPNGHEDWYPSSRGEGELRYFINAIKIIFKNVERIEDIEFTPELILKISDGTIDTNGDGVVDEFDENELYEIMKSKIISDTIIKFIYDYFKDHYK